MRAVARSNPRLGEARDARDDAAGARDPRAQAHRQSARKVADGSRPAVLYSSTQHAREWISTEVNRRLMRWYIERWRARRQRRSSSLLRQHRALVRARREPGRLRVHVRRRAAVAQEPARQQRRRPDHDRRRRRPEPQLSRTTSSTTRRAPRRSSRARPIAARPPSSERETQALKGLLDRIGFAFQVNWHSAGEWLLYAEGWQTSTPTADDPIYFALSGNLDEPAIEGFHPGLSSDVLYVTNGETTDYAHAITGALAWTPELSEGCDGCGFVFPDDDALVQAEFERNLPFAHSVAQVGGRSRTTRSPCSGSRPSRSTSRATTRTRTVFRARTSRSTTPTATRSRFRCWRSAAWAP